MISLTILNMSRYMYHDCFVSIIINSAGGFLFEIKYYLSIAGIWRKK